MSELEAINRVDVPATVASLVRDLQALGCEPDMTLMVHSSLSALGYVSGGAHAVVTALREVLGDDGTLVMPTHSTDLSDPSCWENPPVPEAWWPKLRAEMPAFDPLLTPTRAMGATVECFRRAAGVIRSDHPTVSAAALGPNAAAITVGHQLAHGLGENSPQARLYDLDGHVLLLGVDHANNTSLHLSEYRWGVGDRAPTTHSSPVLVDGKRQWVSFDAVVDNTDDFARLGEDFATETGLENQGLVAAGRARLMKSRAIVDYGVRWMTKHRRP